MLSNKHLYEEIEKVEALIAQEKLDDASFKKAQLKLATLQLKLTHNLRTNIVAVMKHLKVPMVKPKDETQPVEE